MNVIEISNQIRNKLKINNNNKFLLELTSPAMIQALYILSRPIRLMLLNYLDIAEAYYTSLKYTTIGKMNSYSIVEKQLNIIQGVFLRLQEPIDNFFNIIPIDQAIATYLKDNKLISFNVEEIKNSINKLMDIIGDNIPVKIPKKIIEDLSGAKIDIIEVFSNVRSYKDLRDRINDFLWNLTVITNLSKKTETAINYIEKKLEFIKILKETIKTTLQ